MYIYIYIHNTNISTYCTQLFKFLWHSCVRLSAIHWDPLWFPEENIRAPSPTWMINNCPATTLSIGSDWLFVIFVAESKRPIHWEQRNCVHCFMDWTKMYNSLPQYLPTLKLGELRCVSFYGFRLILPTLFLRKIFTCTIIYLRIGSGAARAHDGPQCTQMAVVLEEKQFCLASPLFSPACHQVCFFRPFQTLSANSRSQPLWVRSLRQCLSSWCPSPRPGLSLVSLVDYPNPLLEGMLKAQGLQRLRTSRTTYCNCLFFHTLLSKVLWAPCSVCCCREANVQMWNHQQVWKRGSRNWPELEIRVEQ